MIRDGSILSRWLWLKRDRDQASARAVGDATRSPPVPTADDIASLGAHSDFRPYLQTGVDPQVRARALRVLWSSDPSLSRLDGLIDYGGDYTGSGDQKPDRAETS